MENVITGYHPIAGDIVNIWYTSITGDRYRVVGVSGKFMVCNESKKSRWITQKMYDTILEATRENP